MSSTPSLQNSSTPSEYLMGAEGWRKLAVQQDERALMETIFNGFEVKGWADVSCPLPLWFNARDALKVLDFGCGLGRSLHWLRNNTTWELTGYDTPEMLTRALAATVHGSIAWYDDWELVRQQRFHLVYASLVFQHLHPAVLTRYVRDLSAMTNFLCVRGRDWLDVGRGNVHAHIWPLLQAEGFDEWRETEKAGDHGTIVYMRRRAQ